MPARTRVLVTGAAGRVGAMLRPRLARPGRILRLLDLAPIESPAPGEEAVAGSITDLDAMRAACRDVDAVVHLAGQADEAPWEVVAERNIEGTRTTFEAARLEGVPRVVFASSNHAVGFFARADGPAPDDLLPMPDTNYGASKAAGEAIGALYHHRHGLDVVCVRIGTCTDEPKDLRTLSTWLSPDDAGRLFEAGLSTPSPGYRIVWGISANTRGWFSLDGARALGYEPQDDAERYAPALVERYGEPDLDALEHRFVGGPFCGSL